MTDIGRRVQVSSDQFMCCERGFAQAPTNRLGTWRRRSNERNAAADATWLPQHNNSVIEK